MEKENVKHIIQDTWYKYGVGFLVFEMVIAVLVTVFALFLALSGSGNIFKGGH
jgi:hypothetical protein